MLNGFEYNEAELMGVISDINGEIEKEIGKAKEEYSKERELELRCKRLMEALKLSTIPYRRIY